MDQQNEKRKNWFSKFWKKYSNAVFFIIIVGITSLIIFTQIDPTTFLNTIKTTNISYLFLGIGCIFIYFLLEAYMLLKLMQRENPDEKFSFAFTLTIVGQYYNQIDPSSTGGQPLQLYEMSKKGYSLGTSTAVLVEKYALYQVTITLLAIIGTIYSIDTLHLSLYATKWFIGLGLILNIAAVALIFVLIFNPKVGRKIILGGVRLLLKLHILKDKEKYFKRVDHFIGEYKMSIRFLINKKRETFLLFLISIVQVLIFYSVNYCVYLSLGLSDANVMTMIALQAVLYAAVSFVPTPGSTGGAEAGFLLIFGPIYGSVHTPVAMILWRIISFYFILIFGAIFLSIRSIKMRKIK